MHSSLKCLVSYERSLPTVPQIASWDHTKAVQGFAILMAS